MKLLAVIASFSVLALSLTHAGPARAAAGPEPMLTREDIRMIAPGLEKYTQNALFGDVWKRPGLAPRDRSMVTLAALIAHNQTAEMPYYLSLALDNGVKPREVSEIITHLAFYSGWSNAMAAVAVAKDVFAQRGIEPDQLPAATPPPLPLDEAAEAQRASVSNSSSARWLRESCSTRPTFCSAIYGCVPTLRPGAGVWSRSAL